MWPPYVPADRCRSVGGGSEHVPGSVGYVQSASGAGAARSTRQCAKSVGLWRTCGLWAPGCAVATRLPDSISHAVSPIGQRGAAATNNPPPGGPVAQRGAVAAIYHRLWSAGPRANPNDPRGDWIPRSEPAVPGVTSYASREGRNEVFLDAGGNWQKRLPNGQTQFLDSRASRALDAGRPPPKYRRVSQSEPVNLLALVG